MTAGTVSPEKSESDPQGTASQQIQVVKASATPSSIVSGVTKVIDEFQFKNPHWLLIPVVSAFVLTALNLFLAWCQGLEALAVSADLMSGNPTKASEKVIHPDTISPCYSGWEDYCLPQYITAVYFTIMSMASFMLGCVLACEWVRVERAYKEKLAKAAREEARGSTASRQSLPDAESSNDSAMRPKSPCAADNPFSKFAQEQGVELVAVVPKNAFSGDVTTVDDNHSSGQSPETSGQHSDLVKYNMHHDITKSSQSVDLVLSTSAANAVIANLKQQAQTHIKKFRPGAAWFWHRAWWSLGFELVMAVIRGFIIPDSYARVSAYQTVAQTLLMTGHVNFFCYMYYHRSEIGYVFSNFYSEVAYMSVRLSLNGALSMRCTSFLDFLTLALPLVVTMFEVKHIAEFIQHPRGADRIPLSRRRKKYVWRLTMGIATLATIIGGTITAITIHKGRTDECPKVYGRLEERPEGLITPPGVDCLVWRFDLFKNPSCSCLYMRMSPAYGENCAGFGDDNHVSLQPLLPHLDNLKFLTIQRQIVSRCRMTQADADLIATWTNLRVLQISGFPITAVPPSWTDLTSLVTLDLTMAWLEKLDDRVLRNWPAFESFVCRLCPYLVSMDGLAWSNLNRLSNIEAQGVGTCTRLPSSVLNPICVERDQPSTCTGVPEWILQAYVENAKRTYHSDCFDIACDNNFEFMDASDLDNNGVIGSMDLEMFLWIRGNELNFTFEGLGADSHECFGREIRSAIPAGFEDPKISTFEQPWDGLTAHEYMVMIGRHSSCRECSFMENYVNDAAEVYQFQQDSSNPCSHVNPEFLAPEFEAMCASGDVPAAQGCPGVCGLAVGYIETGANSGNGDYVINEAEFRVAAAAITTAMGELVVDGIFECWKNHTPSCIDRRGDNNATLMSMGMANKVGLRLFDVPSYHCWHCDGFPQGARDEAIAYAAAHGESPYWN